MASDSEDCEWIVESIAGLLGSSMWSLPVADFIEQNCSVFDTEEENKLSYTEIHQQYKELIERLLGGYLEEIGITEEQFLDACTSPLLQSDKLQVLFQPLLAAEDFEVFRSLMVQRNIELQLQALHVIQERNGLLPECLMDGADDVTELEQQEIRILKEVLKKSKEEYEQDLAKKRSQTEIGSASNRTKHSGENVNMENMKLKHLQLRQENEVKVEHLQKVNHELTTTTETAVKCTSLGTDEVTKKKIFCGDSNHQNEELFSGSTRKSTIRTLGPLRVVTKMAEPPQETSSSAIKEQSSNEAAEAWVERAKKEAGISGSAVELTETEKEQLKKRTEYLKQQRDKLISAKKERQNKLGQTKEKDVLKPEPPIEQVVTELESEKLEKRRQLAEKLKEEVIKK
ncbi:cilia- and flagella-associated protein 36 [Protopterus annectens]|uniref:cilia- and flagella-associated protein 36 n=1 Tax=Protopterus annectens TaxID=7888 RepID=UPI001CFAD76F|nr:cilia- and flagella-associated protein 36 [Protopterus annectens]